MSRPRLIVLAVTLTLAACTSTGSNDRDVTGGSPALRVVDAALLPTTTDELPVVDVAGFEELLGELRGTPVVVNFWAAWCEPCRNEMPRLAAAAREHGDSVQFVGVDILDNRGAAEAFIADFEIPFPSLFDVTGETRTAVGGIGQPVTVFYGADGAPVAKVDGELSQAALDEHLAALTA
jgi:thiol-disulfide isomerase/thioredoxin